MSNLKIGIVGGGQLGGLFYQEAAKTSVAPEFYSLSQTEPLLSGSMHWIAVGPELRAILPDQEDLIRQLDVLVLEREDIDIVSLRRLKAEYDVRIIPDPDILEMIQDKSLQKDWLLRHGFPTSQLLFKYKNREELREWYQSREGSIQDKIINKLCKGGYDGRGVRCLTTDTPVAVDAVSLHFEGPAFIEEYVPIVREYSVIIARDREGNTQLLPPSELVMDEESHVLDYLVSPPSKCPPILSENDLAQIFAAMDSLAGDIAAQLELEGLLAIEFFLTKGEGEYGEGRGENGGWNLWINEMSPRPHNSGHHTIEVNPERSQYRLLLECCLGRLDDHPTIPPTTNIPPCVMVNLLADYDSRDYGSDYDYGVRKTCFWSDRFQLTLYGKKEARKGRKMGHIICLTDDDDDRDPGLLADQMRMSVISKALTHPHCHSHCHSHSHSHAVVGVIMGSQSDLKIVKPAIELLEDFRIPYEVRIVSAHRDPDKMSLYAKNAESRGLKVIIAAAGGAAHLPGMVASQTILPVIGIPVRSENSIKGIDSLLSIVQMPGGIPVATMAINGAKNAGLMAARMLGISNPHIAKSLRLFERALRDRVSDMNDSLNHLTDVL